MEITIPALVHGSAQRQFFAGRMSDTFSFDIELPQKRKPSLTKLELNLSPSLLAVMLDGLPYLAQYPYGCVEQTLSRFVPAVIARKAVKDLSLPSERLPPNLDDMVQKGLERLVGFQHGDGGWGWWSSDRTNLWMTAYVVYALGLAKDAGVNVDANMITRGRAYLVGHLGASDVGAEVAHPGDGPELARDPGGGAAHGAESIARHDADLAQQAQRQVVADQFEFEFGRIVCGTFRFAHDWTPDQAANGGSAIAMR